MKSFFTATTIVFGILSALCWLVSAFIKAKPNRTPDANGWTQASVGDGNGNDVVETLKKQSKWNSWAAIFASITAISQSIATCMS